MAMNVKFLKGFKAALPTKRDDTTLYFVTDEGALYLGNTLIGANYTSALEAVNAAIKVINDHGYVNSTEVAAAIGTALESYYTAEQVDAKIGTLKIGDVSYNSVVDYVVAKTTGIATDSVVQGKADKVVPETAGNIAVLTADGNLSDGGESIQDVKDYAQELINDLDKTVSGHNMTISGENAIPGTGIIVSVTQEDGKLSEITVSGNYDEKYDAKGANALALTSAREYTDDQITGLEFELSETGKELSLKNKAGAVVAVVDTTEFVVDGFLTRVEADQANNKLTFYWNTDSGEQKTEIELSSIADIYTGSEGTEVKVAVSNENVISATLSDTVKENIAKGVDAQTRVGVIEDKEVTWDGKQDALTEAQLKAVNSGITAEKVADTATLSGDNNFTGSNVFGKAVDFYGNITVTTPVSETTSVTISKQDIYILGDRVQGRPQTARYKEDGISTNNVNLLYPTQKAAESLTNETLATQEWATQQFADISSLKSAAYATVESLNKTAKGYSEAVQGATTNTVKDCVDAINAMNSQTGEVIGTVENIVNQLTWGEF